MRAYRNRNFPLIYPIGLVNKDFALLLTFSFASIFFDLGTLLDALLGRQSHDNALIIFKVRFLFQLDRDSITY
jgi:hypothetical protein